MIDKSGLIDLWDDIQSDRGFRHLQTEGVRFIPGVGAESPWAFVVGEAPGAEENRLGKPFVGKSGRVLHQLMDLAGMRAYRQGAIGSGLLPNVWLTNTVKFRPPGNRTPTEGEIIAAKPFLRREWALVGRPKLIVAVGSVARDAIWDRGFNPPRGQLLPLKGDVYFAMQYHPAWAIRGDQARKDMIERHWENLGEEIEEHRDELQAYD